MVKINDNKSSFTINISSEDSKYKIIPSNDSSSYFSSLSKSWASKLDGSVDGINYSSKYYAQLAQNSAEISTRAKDSILNNEGFISISEDLTGNNNIGTCAENITSIQNASENAQIASEKATIATQKAEEAQNILSNTANINLSNITDNAKIVLKENGAFWGYIKGNIAEQTDLNNKLITFATTDLNNCTRPYIIETYENEGSWYRIWSDGWCEQGGFLTSKTPDTLVTVTLLKPYKDNTFQVLSSFNNNVSITSTNQASYKVFGHEKLSGKQFKTYQVTFERTWYTFGYLLNESEDETI